MLLKVYSKSPIFLKFAYGIGFASLILGPHSQNEKVGLRAILASQLGRKTMTQTILCTDDSNLSLQQLRSILEPSYEVITCGNGEEALDIVTNRHVDLMILDLTMPVMDGPATLRKLRATGVDIPVIICTSQARPQAISPLLPLGVSDFIVKPPNPRELLEKVRSVFSLIAMDGEVPCKTQLSMNPVLRQVDQPLTDILLIDDMPTVGETLKPILPNYLSLDVASSRAEVLRKIRKNIYRVIIIDSDMPYLCSWELLRQVRSLQPTCQFLGLFLRVEEDPQKLVDEHHLHGHLLKPFAPVEIERFLNTFFSPVNVVDLEQNILTLAPLPANRESRTHHLKLLKRHVRSSLDQIAAAACHEYVVLDLTQCKAGQKMTRLVLACRQRCDRLHLDLRVVGNEEIIDLLRATTDTNHIPIFPNIRAAHLLGESSEGFAQVISLS